MSELPDDVRLWPADPFAVLGVRPGVPEADLKRAYTKLIRRFKPEHAPEQFRRVREAYEFCKERTHWFAPPPEPTPEPPAAPLPHPQADTAPPPERSPADPQPDIVLHAPQPTPPADEADVLWEAFIDGREREAYDGLADLVTARPDRADLPLRLYWLLILTPPLDPDRTRHHWLNLALRRSRLAGPAVELYRREFDARPSAALHDPYADLMAAGAEVPYRLALARWRVAAAGRLGLWTVVHRDLTALRETVPARDEAAWLGLVGAALDWCAWDRAEPLYAFCRDELSALRHLGLSHGYTFDRADELEFLAVGWRAADAAGLPLPLLKLIREGWAGYGSLSPAAVAATAAAVAAEAGHNLRRLDRLLEAGPSSLALVKLLLGWLEAHHADAGPAFPPELIRGVFRAWVGGRGVSFPFLRADLAAFLIDQALHPAEFAAALALDPDPRVRELAADARADLGLWAVALAGRWP